MERTLYRSRTDRMIAGVCGGIAEYTGLDPTLVRLLAVLLALASGGVAVVAYIVMMVIVPETPITAEGVSPMPDQPTDAGGTAEPGAPTSSEPNPQPQSAPPSYAPPYAPPAYAPPQRPAEKRGRGGGIVVGVVLIVVGGIFLAEQFVPRFDVGQYWPVILIIIGLSMVLRRGD